MKYVGEAVRDYGIEAGLDVVALGVATWGVLAHKEKMGQYLNRIAQVSFDGKTQTPYSALSYRRI